MLNENGSAQYAVQVCYSHCSSAKKPCASFWGVFDLFRNFCVQAEFGF